MGKTDGNEEDAVVDKKREFKMTKPKPKPTISNGGGAQRTVQNTNGAETNNTVALSSQFSRGYLEELEERVRSMMEKSQNNYADGHQKADMCKVCGKEGKGNAIKNHIEANHLGGIVLPCNQCEKTFRYRNGLKGGYRKPNLFFHWSSWA